MTNLRERSDVTTERTMESTLARAPEVTYFDYDVTLSFAGEDRVHAEKLAVLLRESGVKVFYDTYEKSTLWGKDLYVHLREIYNRRARFCVIFVSAHYAEKLWTNHERQAAQERAFEEKGREYILPIRIDQTAIPGLPKTLCYLSISDGVDAICKALFDKLHAANDYSLSTSIGAWPSGSEPGPVGRVQPLSRKVSNIRNALPGSIAQANAPLGSLFDNNSNAIASIPTTKAVSNFRQAPKVQPTRILFFRATAAAVLCLGTLVAPPSNDHKPVVPYGNPAEIAWERVQGGPFVMGSNDPRSGVSFPHEELVETFYVSRNEITVEQYKECVMQRGCTPPDTGDQCNWNDPDRKTHPVNCVSWSDAAAYAKWAAEEQKKDVRLPTEDELEYLASNFGKANYPWGNAAPTCVRATLAFDHSRRAEGTSSVCSHEMPLDVKICDLIGNVWEWSQDWYEPMGSNGGTAKVLRGGSWQQEPGEVDARAKDWRDPFTKSPAIGFRVVYSN